MDFLPELKIDSNTYNLVDIQRSQVTAIYKNDEEYVRVGDVEKIARDLAVHKRMEEFGFPVARLRGEGQVGDMSYFREESLGEECFGNIFAREYETSGVISDASWEQLVHICEQFAHAQLRTVSTSQAWPEFVDGIHLTTACEEESAHAQLFADAFSVVQERLSVFPFAISHGDLTPFNIYPKGVIDLEDSFMAPVGFDLGALAEHLEWFPNTSNDRLHQLYTFAPAQKSEYYERVDAVFKTAQVPSLTQYTREFSFTKGVWFAVRLHKHPELMKFRYEHLVRSAKDLLNV
jgi:hypothetical protein